MLNELVDLSSNLTQAGRIPPTGFSSYSAPIRWVAHISATQPAQIYLEEANVQKTRPAISKRTSGIFAYPVADEAAYTFGVDRQKGGGRDTDAAKKHREYLARLWRAYRYFGCSLAEDADGQAQLAIRSQIRTLFRALRRGVFQSDPRYQEVNSKDWVSFILDDASSGIGRHLFDSPEIRAFWASVLTDAVVSRTPAGKPKVGQCAGCGGLDRPLLQVLPTKIKLFARHQLHSYNEAAFVSFVTGTKPHDGSHLGLCLECGEGAAQALNYLADSPIHRRNIAVDAKKMDSLRNIIALFWLKRQQEIVVASVQINLQEALAAPLDQETMEDAQRPSTPRLSQLAALLDIPYTAWAPGLSVGNAFYLAVLSPNVGRVAVREWIAVSLERARASLGSFLQALRLYDPDVGAGRVRTVPGITLALRETDPNLTRGLLRTAYQGHPPPSGLLVPALAGFAIPKPAKQSEAEHRDLQHCLIATIKLALTHGKEEARTLESLDRARNVQGYLCGRLLAVLEEAQRRAATGKLNTTLVDRFFGSVSSAPCAYLPTLIRLAESGHLPKIRREHRGFAEIDGILQELLSRLDDAGGLPRRLTLEGQGEFALGYYHERADLASTRAQRQSTSADAAKGGQQ